MKYKTAFRLALRLVGVWIVASNVPGLVCLVGGLALDFLSDGLIGFADILLGGWGIYQAAGHLIGIGIGLYLFYRGDWIVNKAIPSNRPYCHECGYELTGLPAEGGCPECGTAYRHERAESSPATEE